MAPARPDLDRPEPSASALKPWLRRLWPLAVLAGVAVLVFATGLHERLSFDAFLRQRAELAAFVSANYAVALASFVALYVAVVALSIPGALLLTLASGFLFGPFVGGAATVIAATAGATVIFLVARTSLGGVLRDKAKGRMASVASGFRENAFSYLLFLRLVPVAPFWFVNLVPALVGVSTRTFVAATLIGILPATFAFATIGAGLDSVLAAQAEAKAGCLADGTCTLTLDPGALVTPQLLAGLVALGVVALIPVAAKAYRKRRTGGLS